MKKRMLLVTLLPIVCVGCSAKDPPTTTPVFHMGTPTNRSSVNSSDPYHEPLYTQPGVNAGKPISLPAIASQRGYEPYDPLAQQVYQALVSDSTLPTKYLSVGAKGGVVLLTGTVQSAAQKTRVEDIAHKVPGVKEVRSQITVAPGTGTHT